MIGIPAVGARRKPDSIRFERKQPLSRLRNRLSAGHLAGFETESADADSWQEVSCRGKWNGHARAADMKEDTR